MLFFLLPEVIFGLSVAGLEVLLGVALPIVLFIIIIIIINVMQSKSPQRLPKKLQNWNFLPSPLRSLEPWDKVVASCYGSCQRNCPCCKEGDEEDGNVGKVAMVSDQNGVIHTISGKVNDGYQSYTPEDTRL